MPLKKIFLMPLASILFTGHAQAADYQVQRMRPALVAEILMKDDSDWEVTRGYRFLDQYFHGENHSKTIIHSDRSSNALFEYSSDGFLIQFPLPTRYSAADAPVPTERRVRIRQLRGHRVAVRAVNGIWSHEAMEREVATLREFLNRDGLATLGPPILIRHHEIECVWVLEDTWEVALPLKNGTNRKDAGAQSASGGR